MMNMVSSNSAVGVPLITPVELLKARPGESAGDMLQDVISPGPIMVGDRGKSSDVELLVSVKLGGV